MMRMANRTIPFTNRQILGLFVDISANIASLRGWEESVHLYDRFAIPFSLVCKHGYEATPTRIRNGFSKMMISFHTFNIQVLDANGVISSHEVYSALMQIISAAVRNLLVKSGNFELLVFKPSAAFLLAGKMPLRPCKAALIFSCVSVILKSFSVGSYKQVFQPHIHANRLVCPNKRGLIFFLCKHRDEIFAAWSFGYSHLADFAFYLTVYTTLDTLLEFGYEKPSSCNGGKLRNGETVFGVLGLEVGELRTLLEEIGIGHFKAADCELQCLRVHLFKPCCSLLLLQSCQRLGLHVIVIAFACKPILLFTLIEKVIVHETGTAEMPCQQIGLCLIGVQSELICPVNLSHSAYKVNHYFVNNQIFKYLYGMKENYIRKTRHKYYLKCHLIFCVKYRRKILYGKFDDEIKKEFQRIADNSDFDIDIMETDKDHIHFLISYPPKLSVTSMVRKLKQESTVFAWHLYGNALRQYFWKEKTLWSDGYFVCSIGEANPNTIREYIRQQG